MEQPPSTEPEGTSFLDLPRELRDEIYHLAITTDQAVYLCTGTGRNRIPHANNSNEVDAPIRDTTLSLLRTSQQVRLETQETIPAQKGYFTVVKHGISESFGEGSHGSTCSCPAISRHIKHLMPFASGTTFPGFYLKRKTTETRWEAWFDQEDMPERVQARAEKLNDGFIPRQLMVEWEAARVVIDYIVSSKGAGEDIYPHDLKKMEDQVSDLGDAMAIAHYGGTLAALRAEKGKGVSEEELADIRMRRKGWRW